MADLIEIQDLVVQREGQTVLEVDSLAIKEGEVLAVIGPNGAGKSTLLLVLSRLLPPKSGQVRFRGQAMHTLDELAYRRQIGLVLQDPLLLDVSVFDNVAMGLRFRGLPKAEVQQRANDWLKRLGVLHLKNRPARRLSGGEAQRVSLARAFALQPEVLLLDEPFSALDAPTRARLLQDFQALLSETFLTTVFITHDLDEALYLGDRVAVLLEGRLRQVGPPEQVFSAPANLDVAAFVGVETVISGQVISSQDGYLRVQADGAMIEAVGDIPVGRPVLLCLRPEDITLWPENSAPASSARNRLKGRILRLTPQGPLVRVEINCGFPVVALITRTSAQEMGLAVDQQVAAAFKATAIHLIPRY
ncbi:MAG: ABC transporter ATP-binding protein [Anaerolineales bacterium]|nr:ABC transporter ATP-binding protein [Anaerolineales bacterium]